MLRRRTGRSSRLPTAVVFGLVTVLAGLLTLGGCARNVSVEPPSPGPSAGNQRVAEGTATAKAFADALDRRDRSAFRALSAPGFADGLEAVLANADKLGLSGLEAEYVDTNPGALDSGQLDEYGEDAWVASVRLRYRLADDPGPSTHETAIVMTPGKSGAQIAALGGFGSRSPLWLTGPLQVRRAGRVAVYNAGDTDTGELLARGQRAVSDVRRLLPGWRGRLVIEVPRDKEDLDTDLAADPDTYANIAAVTTTADGSVIPGAPVHVFLNPRVFATLKAKGAQVVLSHEATHVATGAPFAKMPLWLLEGFADYVALHAAGVPVQRAAAQVIARMEKKGLPKHLPGPDDLQPTAEGLGATYEEAWLACRYLGDRWGSKRMVQFYRAVDRGESVPAAFGSVLGTTQRDFIRGWRADLAALVRDRVTS